MKKNLILQHYSTGIGQFKLRVHEEPLFYLGDLVDNLSVVAHKMFELLLNNVRV